MRVLIVDYSDTFRAPIAGFYLKQISTNFKVITAGAYAEDGSQLTASAIEVLNSFNIKHRAHTSHKLSYQDLRVADIVLCMENSHVEVASVLLGTNSSKIEPLSNYCNEFHKGFPTPCKTWVPLSDAFKNIKVAIDGFYANQIIKPSLNLYLPDKKTGSEPLVLSDLESETLPSVTTTGIGHSLQIAIISTLQDCPRQNCELTTFLMAVSYTLSLNQSHKKLHNEWELIEQEVGYLCQENVLTIYNSSGKRIRFAAEYQKSVTEATINSLPSEADHKDSPQDQGVEVVQPFTDGADMADLDLPDLPDIPHNIEEPIDLGINSRNEAFSTGGEGSINVPLLNVLIGAAEDQTSSLSTITSEMVPLQIAAEFYRTSSEIEVELAPRRLELTIILSQIPVKIQCRTYPAARLFNVTAHLPFSDAAAIELLKITSDNSYESTLYVEKDSTGWRFGIRQKVPSDDSQALLRTLEQMLFELEAMAAEVAKHVYN